MSMFKTVFFISVLLVSLYLLVFLTGCSSMVDFRNKAIAVETTVIGFDISIPDIFSGMTSSLLNIRFGYITNRYTSAPIGAKAYSESEYTDVSIWKLTGNVKTKVGVENIGEVSEDAPKKDLVN